VLTHRLVPVVGSKTLTDVADEDLTTRRRHKDSNKSDDHKKKSRKVVCTCVYSVSQKNFPEASVFFSNGWEFLVRFLHIDLRVPNTAVKWH